MTPITNDAGQTRVITITGLSGSPIRATVYTEEEGYNGWFRFDIHHLNGPYRGRDANYRQGDGGTYVLSWETL